MNRIASTLRSNALALVALFVALSGTAVAAGGLITGDKIAAETITSTNIATDAVGQSELGAAAVTSTEVQDGSLTGNDIATDAVGLSELAPSAVTSTEVMDYSLTGNDIAMASIPLSKIATLIVNYPATDIAAQQCAFHNYTVPAGSLATVFATGTAAGDTVATMVDNDTALVKRCNRTLGTAQMGFKLYAFKP